MSDKLNVGKIRPGCQNSQKTVLLRQLVLGLLGKACWTWSPERQVGREGRRENRGRAGHPGGGVTVGQELMSS